MLCCLIFYYAGRFEELPGLHCEDVYGAFDTDFKFIALCSSDELPYICQYAGTLLLIPLNFKWTVLNCSASIFMSFFKVTKLLDPIVKC